MRIIHSDTITKVIEKAVIDANLYLPESLCNRIDKCAASESDPLAKDIFSDMQKNLDCAKEYKIPICQDCGMAVIFAEVGQNVFIDGENFEDAVNRGVASGYINGFLRKSIVGDPLERINTEDNTPAIIHTRIVPGDKIRFTVAPKGFGSENMSKIKMFNPTAKKDDIIDFVVDCIKVAGSKPCPPLVVGVGIGGDFEYSALLAKKALCRDVEVRHPKYSDIEQQITDNANKLNIGAQGFGGDTTVLACNIETFATHIAGLPVAVNIGCHVTRHLEVEI